MGLDCGRQPERTVQATALQCNSVYFLKRNPWFYNTFITISTFTVQIIDYFGLKQYLIMRADVVHVGVTICQVKISTYFKTPSGIQGLQ